MGQCLFSIVVPGSSLVARLAHFLLLRPSGSLWSDRHHRSTWKSSVGQCCSHGLNVWIPLPLRSSQRSHPSTVRDPRLPQLSAASEGSRGLCCSELPSPLRLPHHPMGGGNDYPLSMRERPWERDRETAAAGAPVVGWELPFSSCGWEVRNQHSPSVAAAVWRWCRDNGWSPPRRARTFTSIPIFPSCLAVYLSCWAQELNNMPLNWRDSGGRSSQHNNVSSVPLKQRDRERQRERERERERERQRETEKERQRERRADWKNPLFCTTLREVFFSVVREMCDGVVNVYLLSPHYVLTPENTVFPLKTFRWMQFVWLLALRKSCSCSALCDWHSLFCLAVGWL